MNLSYSSLSMMKDCKRCFYLDRRLKMTRPQGIKSGMPTAVDNILKEQLEPYRGALPPVLDGHDRLSGFVLYKDPEMAKMRHWASNPLNLNLIGGHKVVGAFDDLLYNPTTKEFAYLDYKTTGKEPDQLFGEKYYQSQCDIYTRFLEAGGRKFADFGVLLFFWPVTGKGGFVDFQSKAIFLKPNPAAAVKVFKDALTLLECDDVPPVTVGCEYCGYVGKVGQVE